MCSERHSRQSFLGPDSERTLADCTVGIVGLGGGGSHIAQQLAHVGVRDFVLRDPDTVEDSNLNRLVGGTAADALLDVPKVHALGRLILGVAPDARVEALQARWQNDPEALRRCDVFFGCVDSFAQRHELEVFARRSLIPYIDIGLDVVAVDGEPPQMGGQVFLSMPGAAMPVVRRVPDGRAARAGGGPLRRRRSQAASGLGERRARLQRRRRGRGPADGLDAGASRSRLSLVRRKPGHCQGAP